MPNTPSEVIHIWLIAFFRLAPFQRMTSGTHSDEPKKTYSMKIDAMIAIAGPNARRAASNNRIRPASANHLSMSSARPPLSTIF